MQPSEQNFLWEQVYSHLLIQSKLRINSRGKSYRPSTKNNIQAMEGMRVFSSSWDFCCLKTMTTSLMEACEPSQEKLKAAVKFLPLLWALISLWGVSILFYKGKWAAGFSFRIRADLLVLELLRWRHLDTLQLLRSGRKQISICNKILPMVILKV